MLSRNLRSWLSHRKVKEVIKRERPEVINARIFVTSVNGLNQKLEMFEVTEQHARTLLNCGKIKIEWVVCKIRMRMTTIICRKCLDNGYISATCQESDRRIVCPGCGRVDYQAKTCNGRELRSLQGSSDKSVAHTANSGRYPVSRAELEKLRTRLA